MTLPVPTFQHRTVLLSEAVDALAIDRDPQRANGVYVDGTFGRGGHSRAILARLGPQGRLIAFDKDPQAVAAAHALARGEAGTNPSIDPAANARFVIVHESFATLAAELARRGLTPVQGILLDLGVSSPQIDEAERGFSFRNDGPLDMRMDPTRGMPASEWLATASLDEITKVIREYGEERFAFQIAKTIVARRAERPLSRTRELAALVASAIGARRSKKDSGQDPATRTFQAIRIYINQELAELEQGLIQAMSVLAPAGRLVVISFHSLEDRIVKRFMQGHANPPQPPARMPIKAADLPKPRMKLIAKIMPGTEELNANPRARSAVMRVAESLQGVAA